MAVGPRVLEEAGPQEAGFLSRLREWWEREEVFGYGLILPALVLLVALVAFPFGMAIYFSLSDYWVGSPGAFVGLDNYRAILGNEVFRQTVQNSFVFTAIALTLKTVLGVWLAVLLARPVRFKRLIRGAILLPFVIPTALSTLGWWWMFDSLYSVVNWTAIRFGLMSAPGPNWLGQAEYAMAAVIAVNVWRGLPFFAITTLAGLVAVPREYYEAAEVDGAGAWSRFWLVTLPAAQARARGGDSLLDHFHLRRLQHRLRPHARRADEHHPPLRHPRLSGRPQRRQPRPGRCHRPLHLPAPRRGGLLPAPLRPEGMTVATARSRGATIRYNAFTYANLAPFVFFALFPFYFMFVTSFKSNAELYNLKSVPFWVQTGVITDHYTYLFMKTDFLVWIKNSLLISVVATSVSIVLSILAGYSLSRLRFRGAGSFGLAVFITYLVPPTLLFLPLSQVVSWLGLSDSIYALMVTYPTFLVPFCTWLLMGYFRTVPREVEECALVDGATRMQTLFRIVLPMAVPGIICALLFSFTLCWNEFTYALTFISQSANKTAVVGVTADLIRGDIYYWGSLMAGAVLASVPVVIVYVLFLDYYVSGLTAGAVKG